MKIVIAILVSLIATTMFVFDAIWALPEGPLVAVSIIAFLAVSIYYCSKATSTKKAFSRGCFIYVIAVVLLPVSAIILGLREIAVEDSVEGEMIAAGGSLILTIFSFVWAFSTGIVAAILGFVTGRGDK